jgi:hypothetical protein
MAAILKKKKGGVSEHKTRVLYFSVAFIWNISHSKMNSVRYNKKMYSDLHVKYLLFLSNLNENFNFLQSVSKNTQT